MGGSHGHAGGRSAVVGGSMLLAALLACGRVGFEDRPLDRDQFGTTRDGATDTGTDAAGACTVACPDGAPMPTDSGGSGSPLLAPCSQPEMCASGYCYSVEDDPFYMFVCFGSMCSQRCEPLNDQQCRDLAASLNAPLPGLARCTTDPFGATEDDWVCDLFAAGLGDLQCE